MQMQAADQHRQGSLVDRDAGEADEPETTQPVDPPAHADCENETPSAGLSPGSGASDAKASMTPGIRAAQSRSSLVSSAAGTPSRALAMIWRSWFRRFCPDAPRR